ncbi:MAG TPA: molybdopterin-dependent oxidoreductase [Rhodanobacteraceae bacterium]|nr:molybdopterin-dependent oxidoreductase [Rhodanobacteraceae bacterium]
MNLPTGDAVKTTTCYMCACRCGIRVHLKDGRVRYIDGNPDHPVNRGVICAKGSAGIKQHYSPARLSKPLLRVGERGAGEFREIEWDEALALAAQWLGDIRARNPDELAFFTGRDQSQALTGWWAQQFGTLNYAAHGGFCSVNMAAAGMYTFGGSFWEFGEPDWELSQYLMLWGVAEDHDSNPIKTGLGKLKARGAKIVAINPVRSGYAAIADEWVPINPGTDGLLAGALIQELLRADRIDFDYLVRYTNAHHLVIQAPGSADHGLIARDADGHALCAANEAGEVGITLADAIGIAPRVVGEVTLADGRRAVPAFQLLAERFLAPDYAPERAAAICGIPAATIRRLARELAEAAFDRAIEIKQPWIDSWGRRHESMRGRPVAMHAMRGISAHVNGFHTCRTLHLLQLLLGAIDTPGSFRYQPPCPKPPPPGNRPAQGRKADGTLAGGPLGYVHAPEDLVVDADGRPRRLDKAFSWEYPLAAHGLMHAVIRNAWAGDPCRIDTLFMFMANMSWNSAMNTTRTQQMLTDRDASGAYRIPHILYVDAYHSEMVNYADLVLPDTTYLERHDCISLLDRPISDADVAADAIRHPVVAPDRDVRPFQDVLLDLGARLGLPGMVDEAGQPLYRDYADYMVRHQRAPGVGPLAGWRGEVGEVDGIGAPNPAQLQRYIEHGGYWEARVPAAGRYYKMANRHYLEWAKSLGLAASTEALVLEIYSEKLQRFRLAAEGHGERQPPAAERARVQRYFDPLPFWYASLDPAAASGDYPLHAITQRPMFMYHAWGSQNAWLRQIAARNALYLNPATAAAYGVADGDWVWLASPQGRIRVEARHHAGTAPGTVWCWNAIGKARGTWGLAADAPESRDGFLFNHLISDVLMPQGEGQRVNADPVTGQAAWFDLKVAIEADPAPRRPGHRIELAEGAA